jgi:hypothetical protein
VIHRTHIGWEIWGAGVALGVLAGASVGACGLPGATSGPSPTPMGSGGAEASSSSRGPSASSGHQVGTGGMGGTSASGGGGSAGATASAASTGGGPGGATASSSTGPTRSCTDEYGSAPGFYLCVETPTYCDFNLNTGSGATSCGATCSQLGGMCIIEMDNLGNCDLFTDGGFACDDSHFGTTLCRCSHF